MVSAFGNNVNEYYVNLARQNFDRRAKRLALIHTPEQAAQYVTKIQAKIKKIFHFPARTPLNAVVTGKNAYSGYTVENLYYFSRPGFPATANLYLPEHFSGRVPAVLMLCGHADEGKASSVYRTLCIHLALQGYAVLIPDPVEQGERRQYLDFAGKDFDLCGNHNLMGKNLMLCGEWFGAWRTWDAIRGLDYLESRPEIDRGKLHVTGNSGGGTLTTLVAAVDDRPIAVAPSCYITSWKHNIENELPSDIEQMPPQALKLGLEMGDLLLAQAPRNILILGQKNDFFDPRGVTETWSEIKKINGLLGGKTEYFIGPCDHGLSQENREAIYRFFSGKPYTEHETGLPAERSILALPDGKLENLPENLMLRTLTEKMAAAYSAKRKKMTAKQIRETLRDLLVIEKPQIPYYRVLRPAWEKDAVRNRFGLETEPGIIMSVLSLYAKTIIYHIETKIKKITLHITGQNGQNELKERQIRDDEALFALDVRGLGELMPSGTDQYEPRSIFSPYQFDYHYAALAIMLGKPMLGLRVYDILCALELLGKDGAEITLEADGPVGIPAVMAAALSDKVKRVKLTNMPKAYADILHEPVSDLPLSFICTDILQYFDLPDLIPLISARQIKS